LSVLWGGWLFVLFLNWKNGEKKIHTKLQDKASCIGWWMAVRGSRMSCTMHQGPC
jgi:hypothetical protein